MTTFHKYLYILTCLLLCIGCDTNQSIKGNINTFVAKDAVVILKISDLKTFQKEVADNQITKQFGTQAIYSSVAAKNSFLSHIQPDGISILSLYKRNDSVHDIAIATKQLETVFQLDSITNKTVETIAYGDITMRRVRLDDDLFFTASKDSVFIASSSQAQLEAILSNTSLQEPQFKKALTVLQNTDLNTTIRAPRFSFSEENSHALGTYQSLDMVLTPNGAIASGVALVHDSIPQLLSVFKGQVPQQNDLEQVIPRNATKAVSITLSDPSLFIENLSKYRGAPISEAPLELLSTTNEIGDIKLPTGNAVVLKSIDPTATQEALASSLTETGSFRETMLFGYDDENLFKETLYPFVESSATSVSFQLEDFFVFAQNTQVAEGIISAYKNNNCIAKDTSFLNNSGYTSNASSLLIFGMNTGTPQVIEQLENVSSLTAQNTSSNVSQLALLQYSFDRDFAHVHFACLAPSEGERQTNGGVTEVFSKTFEKDLMTSPSFFSNHRTGKKNIVVQDIGNTLHLLSDTGKTLWTKMLDEPINGNIQEIDILRNGRKQMTFVTENKWYVLDRNGKDVKGFPVTFKDKITQPLSVFDYDNNRKYRFAIVQGKEILLYDSKAKMVKGFTFKKAKSTIVLPPSHIRMGNKDYILVAEQNGTLNILSRTGKVRVPVKETFNFSENYIQREGSTFVVITKANQKKSITTNGKVSTVTLDVSSNYHFVTKGNTKITLDDNLLRINGKLTELPFGIYTAPKIFKANRKTFVTVTETQEKKVYVLQKDGTIVNGFPIFGSSEALLSNTKQKILLTVVGQKNEVVLVQL